MINDHGLEGYGRWWRMLEIISKRMDKSDVCHAEYPENVWATLLKQKQKKLRTFLVYCQNKLKTKVEYSGNIIRIEVPKLLEIRDEFCRKSGVTPESVRSDSGPKIENKNKEKEKDLSAHARKELASPFWESRNSESGKDKIDWKHHREVCSKANDLTIDQWGFADLAWGEWDKNFGKGLTEIQRLDFLRFAYQLARTKPAKEIFDELKARKFKDPSASETEIKSGGDV